MMFYCQFVFVSFVLPSAAAAANEIDDNKRANKSMDHPASAQSCVCVSSAAGARPDDGHAWRYRSPLEK